MLSDTQIQRLIDLANAACQKGFVDDARVMLDGVLALRPDCAPARIGLAFTHIVVDDFDGAVAILDDQVLARNPDDFDALALKGLAFMLAGRSDEARETLGRVPEDAAASDMARAVLAEMN